MGLLVKLPVVGGCRETAALGLPAQTPLLDQRLPTSFEVPGERQHKLAAVERHQ
jgi:hypothetical protein